jgi:ABC-2 type transport system permease protein
MQNVWIIFQREYLNIVRKPSFLLSTFIVPLGFAAIFGVQILATLNVEKESYTVLARQDAAAPVFGRIKSDESLAFTLSDLPADSLQQRAARDKSVIYLDLDAASISSSEPRTVLYSKGNLSLPVVRQIENRLEDALQSYKQEQAGITQQQLDSAAFKLNVETLQITEKGVQQGVEGLATIVGFIMAFVIYMLVAIYGSMLMQGIIEEKSTRVVEVIVSSVKPFHLLMGKTVGLACVGLTQFVIWIVLSVVVVSVLTPLIGGNVDPAALQQPGMGGAQAAAVAEGGMQKIMAAIQVFPWLRVLSFLPLYFLGGFFLYGSLLAAAGSAVDNIQDAQQFTFPITMPLIVPMITLYNIVQNPNSTMAWIFSIVPFFSPMTMPVRLAMSEVPWYEIVLSLALLIGGFIGSVWVAGRIYRTGILMYGKKPSFRELFRWISYRQ